MNELLSKILVSVGSFSKNFSGLDGLMSSTVNSGGSLLFLFFLFTIFLSALSFGKTRIILALLATYISAYLESIFLYQSELAEKFSDFLKFPAVFWARLLVFIVFFVMAFLILNRSILKPKMSLQESPPVTIFVLSMLQGIFWLTILLSFLPAGNSVFSGYLIVAKYLAGPSAGLIWSFIPLLAMLLLRRKKTV